MTTFVTFSYYIHNILGGLVRQKFRKTKPYTYHLTLQYIIGYFFVVLIFYSFYKKVKLNFFIGYDFFQEGAHIFHMFRDAI